MNASAEDDESYGAVLMAACNVLVFVAGAMQLIYFALVSLSLLGVF